MAGMKQILLMIAVVALVGCGKKEVQGPSQPEPPKPSPTKLIADPIVEEAIRKSLNKPTGELTQADLTKVTKLNLFDTQITDAGLKEVAKLEKLTQLRVLFLQDNPNLTKAQIDELQRALPNCRIESNPTK